MAETISSAANPLVKRIRALADRKYRREQGAFVVEGIQPVWRAVTAGWDIEALLIDPRLRQDSPAAAMADQLRAGGIRVARLTGELFLRLSSREGSPGLLAIVRSRPLRRLADMAVGQDAVFVALHRIANPGNLGTIVRTADAAGAAGVILIGDTTDPYAPAAVKASMGSIFAVSLSHVGTQDAFLAWAGTHDVAIVATSGQACQDHWHAVYRPPLAVLLGSEGEGLPADLLTRADKRVRIPMTGTAESLNLAAAAAVMLYEIRRHTAGGAGTGDTDLLDNAGRAEST